MLVETIAELIFTATILGFLLLLLVASEANNRTMTRVWGYSICMAIVIGLAILLELETV
jgi:hypothetical protein